MRESNFSYPAQNRASVGITSTMYDRRGLDCTALLPLVNSLTHLVYLTSTSPRIREIICEDGGIERLIKQLKITDPSDKKQLWKWHLTFHCIVNTGVRGSEHIRTRVVEAGLLPVVIKILETFLHSVERMRDERHRQYDHAQAFLLAQSVSRGVQNDVALAGLESHATPVDETARQHTAYLRQHTSQRQRRQPDVPWSQAEAGPSTTRIERQEQSQGQSWPEAQASLASMSSARAENGRPETPQGLQPIPGMDDPRQVLVANTISTGLQQTDTDVVMDNTLAVPVTEDVRDSSGDDMDADERRQVPVESEAGTAQTRPAWSEQGAQMQMPRLALPPHAIRSVPTARRRFVIQEREVEAEVIYVQEDISLSLQLLAYISKYPHLRVIFHKAYDVNIFSLVERFTYRPPANDPCPILFPSDFSYWAAVVMRNACRKDETNNGIRQCANMECGKWEDAPSKFAKCRRCRKAKYCSKACQSRAWNSGHRWWCQERPAHPSSTRADQREPAEATAAEGVEQPIPTQARFRLLDDRNALTTASEDDLRATETPPPNMTSIAAALPPGLRLAHQPQGTGVAGGADGDLSDVHQNIRVHGDEAVGLTEDEGPIDPQLIRGIVDIGMTGLEDRALI